MAHLPRFADYRQQDYITLSLNLKKNRWLKINLTLFIWDDDEPAIHLYFLHYIVNFFFLYYHCKYKLVLFNATKYGNISCLL